jgi:hypothetical protein
MKAEESSKHLKREREDRMGTNYYAYDPSEYCEYCGRTGDPRHIGKSSAGWCFSLRVYPDEGINTLDDWKGYLRDKIIRDEYGRRVSLDEMLKCITERSRRREELISEEILSRNHAELGPNGLLRSRVDDRFCIGHGEGTWDYIVGEFS